MSERSFRIGLALFLVAASSTMVGAEDPLAIGEVLENAGPFHLKTVTLRGVVRDLKALEPYYQPSGAGCYGAYTFRVEDDTGSLPISVLGICGNPLLRPLVVQDGDHVIMTAQIHASEIRGESRALDGTPLQDLDPDGVYGVATWIGRDPARGASTSPAVPSPDPEPPSLIQTPPNLLDRN